MSDRDASRLRRYQAAGRERLQELAEVLDGVPEDEFDIDHWQSCGVGHAARDPWFQAQGLGLSRAGNVLVDGELLLGAYGFAPVARFFGVSPTDARRLFSGTTTPGRLARRIRRLMAGLPF